MPELQTVPARHGVATFVPAGQTIKIVNSSGSQVVDTWAFALPSPEIKNGEEQRQGGGGGEGGRPEQNGQHKAEQPQQEQAQQKAEDEKAAGANARPTPKKSRKSGMSLPSQEEAEKATREGLEKEQQGQQQQQQQGQQKKNTWSSYVPSIGWSKNGSKQGEQPQQGETEKQKNSRTWGSYIPSGKAYSNYIPKSASDTVVSLASSHQRDPNKTYVQQLKDFSQTPVGAAGIKGFAALSGSGYSGSLYAGYQAWNAMNAPDAPPMEFLSMPHTRSSTLHMAPKVNDLLISNLREPMMTLVEDTSSTGCHDTLIAACDPVRYRQLGVEHWEEHGSCAENLVLALKELNERAGLKGAKGVGAEVTINNVPAPLNLFMNVPWDEQGELAFKSPKTKAGDYVRLRAERDVVVVLSSCPMDVTDINGKKIDDAHFLVEGGEAEEAEKKQQQRKTVPRRRPAPRKINSSNRAPSTVATGEMADDDKSQLGSTPVAKKTVPARRTAPAKRTTQSQAGQGAAPAKKSAAATAAPKKKPIPRPAGTPANVNEGAAANGSATPTTEAKPVEKKKPRKLVRPAAAQAEKEGE